MGMGRGQAVRQQVLILLFGGSNPSVPDLFHWFLFSLPSLFPFFFRKRSNGTFPFYHNLTILIRREECEIGKRSRDISVVQDGNTDQFDIRFNL
jgi:hypothetical protein